MLTGFLSSYLINKRMKIAQTYLEGKKRILDVGCGMFKWQAILPSAVEYVGVDRDGAIIKYNQERFSHRFFRANVEIDSLSALGSGFDLILLLAVIEHFNEPALVLKKLRPILGPDGIIVLTTPHPRGRFILHFGAKIKIFAPDKHEHHSMLGYKEIKEIAEIADYRVISYKHFLCGFNQLVMLGKYVK